ncbi:MAG: flagellin [Myxococcota bacterium]|jgi:flagellin|nr:flagellin [Myxococcota bacterium]
MALTVNTNVAALAARGDLGRTQDDLGKSLARISSGLRVKSSADDAAGMGVATNLKAVSRSGEVAMRNTGDGISIIQTAEGASSEITDILSRMRELAVQASSEALDTQERSYINDEFDQLSQEITRISDTTEFNGIKLLNGSDTSLQIQVGISSTAQISIALQDVDSSQLGLSAVTMATATGAQAAIDSVDSALDTMNTFRAALGAVQNRLDVSLSAMSNYVENLTAAASRIVDADFAYETAEMTKLQIMQSAGIASLSQARNINQGVISLLG